MLSERIAKPARLAYRRKTATASKSFALALILTSTAFAQVTISPINPPPTDAVMGFEGAGLWTIKSSSPATTGTATAIRTQGTKALAVANPSGVTVSLTSAGVASTEPALAAVADADSVFAVDVMPPSSGGSGSLALAVSSASLGLKDEVGTVPLSSLKPFIYTTVKFPIPASVRSAIAGKEFKDLTFALVLSGSSISSGSSNVYLLDNLRAVALSPVTAKLGVTLPVSFGGSLSLVAQGNVPASQSFPISTVQVPETFRLAAGNAAGTTVQLKLGYDGAAAYTCAYNPDPSDTAGLSYTVANCTGGVAAGDVVGANYASLTIVNGSAEMKLQADFARNAVGDQVGRSLIPSMPTYWGKADTCVPAPAAGTVFTISPSCTAQINEASQISTAYFNTVNNSQAPYNFIASPAADRSLAHGNGLPPQATSNPAQSNDIPINESGHVNKGGDFDAYWVLTGDFNTKDTPATGSSSAHFDAEFGGHIVAFGGDVDVVDVKATLDSVTGSSPSATGSVSFFLFGEQVPGGGSVNASTPINYNLSTSQTFNLPPVEFWIFTLQVGATANASLKATGTLAATGFNVTVDPQVTMGVSISGGVNLGIASGEVDAKINLLQVEVPINAQAGLVVNADPSACSISIDLNLNAKVTVSALGGEIDLKASFGPCPFCYSDSYTLVKWSALESTTQTLFSIGPDTLAAVELPTALCTPNIKSTITLPGANAQIGITYPLQATAATIGGTSINCNDFKWSVSPAETITGTGCTASIEFAKTGPHTLTLAIAASFTDSFGRTISGTGTGTEAVSVSTLAPGTYIIDANPAPTNVQAPFNNQTAQFGNGAGIQFTGEYVGPATGVNETWTMTNGAGQTVTMSSQLLPNNQSQASWPGAALPAPGTYTVTMTTTDSTGKSLGSATMTVRIFGSVLHM
ncbi:MAG TPA: hypothetical protein VML19_29305 [Verrucomicrobiae bacterium]|nr:hypothetical protein [Verrucomicrobiae bacterium]